MVDIISIIAVAWIFLATAVAVHAYGHNRRSVLWFTVTAITGIFGIVVYLLVITSAGSREPEDGVSPSEELSYILAGAGGMFAALIAARVFTAALRILTRPPSYALGTPVSSFEPLAPPIWFISGVSGVAGSLYILHTEGTKPLVYRLSFTPVVSVSFLSVAVLSPLSPEMGIFFEEPILAPVLLLTLAMLFSQFWRVIALNYIFTEQDTGSSESVILTTVDTNRRKVLAGLGGISLLSVGYGSLTHADITKPEERENKIITPSGVTVSELTSGYSESAKEFRVSATVQNNTESTITGAKVKIDYKPGTLSHHIPLETFMRSGSSDTFTSVVEEETGNGAAISTDPETIEWFVLRVVT